MRRHSADLIVVAAVMPPPKRRSLSAKAIVCCLILCLTHSGCATSRISPTPPSPPSDGERASFGNVGVARAYYLPKTGVNVFAKGRLAGAGGGAMFILLLLLTDLPNPDDSQQVESWWVTAAAAVPIGAVYGAIVAMPGDEVDSCEMLLREILKRANPQEDLQNAVLRAGTKGAETRLFPVDEVGLKNIDNVATCNFLEGKGVHTVLEVSVERIELKADKKGSDPPLALIMEARSRLVRVSDGTVVNVNTFSHSSSPRKFTEWAADNAVLLDQEYGDGIRQLALDIISWNFTS